MLPGCRGPHDPGYDPRADGTTRGLRHPFTGQPFRSELSALSWNLLMTATTLSTAGQGGARSRFAFDALRPFRSGGCSFREPQWCSGVASFLSLTGVQRDAIRAGGNGAFGRRDFVWHSGGTGVLRVDKANVLSLSVDFPEPRTRTTWALEASWVEGVHLGDANSLSGASESDLFALAVAVERPTYVRFLNPARSFHLHAEAYVEWAEGHRRGFARAHAFEAWLALSATTGYAQDRLIPSLTVVYDLSYDSFAVVPQVTLRLREDLSATVGIAAFAGEEVARPLPLAGITPASERFGRHAYQVSTEPALAAIRERDEVFLRVRWTF
jgi:hypothetical protein